MDRNKRKRVFRRIMDKIDCTVVFADRKGYILESSEPGRVGQFVRLPGTAGDTALYRDGSLLICPLTDMTGGVQYVGIDHRIPGAETLLRLIGVMALDELDEMTQEDFILEALGGKFTEEQLLHYMKKFSLPLHQSIQVLVVQIKVEHGDDVEFILNTLFAGEPVLRVSANRYAVIRRPDRLTGEEAGRRIYQGIFSELMFVPYVGVGTVADSFLEISSSFAKAVKALETGMLHDSQAGVYSYRKLAVPLLIDHMDFASVENLYQDTAGNINAVLNDEELIVTALRFFENDLNITETSRKLYVHRNTLIYRLNKIHKLTSYDLRRFEDALNFSVGLHLHNVMKSHGA